MQTVLLKINGMTCQGCVDSVIKALQQVNGVIKIDVSLENHQAKIQFDEQKTTVQTLTEVIDDIGFDVML